MANSRLKKLMGTLTRERRVFSLRFERRYAFAVALFLLVPLAVLFVCLGGLSGLLVVLVLGVYLLSAAFGSNCHRASAWQRRTMIAIAAICLLIIAGLWLMLAFGPLPEDFELGWALLATAVLTVFYTGALVALVRARSALDPNRELVAAASPGGAADVKWLIEEKGADANTRDANGSPLLANAAGRGAHDVVEALLTHGANPDASDTAGVTPLMGAAMDGHSEVVKLLLQAGARPDKAAEGGRTALHAAADFGHADVARVLIEAGASVDAKTGEGVTPLEVAAYNGYADVVRLLLVAGADPMLRDDHGRTAMDAARLGGHKKIAQMLVDSGEDLFLGGT